MTILMSHKNSTSHNAKCHRLENRRQTFDEEHKTAGNKVGVTTAAKTENKARGKISTVVVKEGTVTGIHCSDIHFKIISKEEGNGRDVTRIYNSDSEPETDEGEEGIVVKQENEGLRVGWRCGVRPVD